MKKTVLAGLDMPDFSALKPAAQHWLNTIAHVRLHGETRKRPADLWATERPYLTPLPIHPFDIAPVSQVRASRQFRITLDTNRYAVPAYLAGQRLTLKAYPDRLCIYPGDTLVASHPRRSERFLDIEDPDHPKPLLEQRARLPPEASALYLSRRHDLLATHLQPPDLHISQVFSSQLTTDNPED